MLSRGTTSFHRHLTIDGLTEYTAEPVYSCTVTGAPVAAYLGHIALWVRGSGNVFGVVRAAAFHRPAALFLYTGQAYLFSVIAFP